MLLGHGGWFDVYDYPQNCPWFEVEDFLKQLEELAEASYENSGEIVKLVEKIVPTFHSGKNVEKDPGQRR